MIYNANSIVVIQQVNRNKNSNFFFKEKIISLGSLNGTNDGQRNRLNLTHENHHRTNILGPKHFIVEEENEALLAKELQEAKIQSSHNSHSSMHSSQPQVFHLQSNDSSMKNLNVINEFLHLNKEIFILFFFW
jgi:hypothetical protein